MDELTKGFVVKIDNFGNELKAFIKGFEERHEEKVKSLEASAKQHSSMILNAREEIESLQGKKKDLLAEMEDVKDKAAKLREGARVEFKKIMDGERSRIEQADTEFKARKIDYEKMQAETLALNQKAKGHEEDTAKLNIEVRKLVAELDEKLAVCNDKIARYQKVSVENDTLSKELLAKETSIDKSQVEVDLRFKELVEKANKLTAEGARIKELELKVRAHGEDLVKQKAEIINREEAFVVREKEFEKQNAQLTTWRSDLAAKEQNLKVLEKELKSK